MLLLVKKNKNTVPLTYIISDLKSKEIAGISMKKIQMLSQLGVEKVTRKKGYYVKWKGYGNSFNRWIDKKGIV